MAQQQHPFNMGLPPPAFNVGLPPPTFNWAQASSFSRPYYFMAPPVVNYPFVPGGASMPINAPQVFVRSPSATSVCQFTYGPPQSTDSSTLWTAQSDSYSEEDEETIYRQLTEHLIENGPCSMSTLYHCLSLAGQRTIMRHDSMREFLLASDYFVIDDATKFVTLTSSDRSSQTCVSSLQEASASNVSNQQMVDAMWSQSTSCSLPMSAKSLGGAASKFTSPSANPAVMQPYSSQFAVGKCLSQIKYSGGGAGKAVDSAKSLQKINLVPSTSTSGGGNSKSVTSHRKRSSAADKPSPIPASSSLQVPTAVSSSSHGKTTINPVLKQLSSPAAAIIPSPSNVTVSISGATTGSSTSALSSLCASIDRQLTITPVTAAGDSGEAPSLCSEDGRELSNNDAIADSRRRSSNSASDSRLRADAPVFCSSAKRTKPEPVATHSVATTTTISATIAADAGGEENSSVLKVLAVSPDTASGGDGTWAAHDTNTPAQPIGENATRQGDCDSTSASTQCCNKCTPGDTDLRDPDRLCDRCRAGREAAENAAKRRAALDQLEIDVKATMLMMSLVTTDQHKRQAAVEDGSRVLDVIFNRRSQATSEETDDVLPSMPASLQQYNKLIKDTGLVLNVLTHPSTAASIELMDPPDSASHIDSQNNVAAYEKDHSVIASTHPHVVDQSLLSPASNVASSITAQLSGDMDTLRQHLLMAQQELLQLQREQTTKEQQQQHLRQQLLLQHNLLEQARQQQLEQQKKQLEQAREQHQKQLEQQELQQAREEALQQQQQKVTAIIQACGGATAVLSNPALLALVKGVVDSTLSPTANQPSASTDAPTSAVVNSSNVSQMPLASNQSLHFPSATLTPTLPLQSNPLAALFTNTNPYATAPRIVNGGTFSLPPPQQHQSSLMNLAAPPGSNSVSGWSWPRVVMPLASNPLWTGAQPPHNHLAPLLNPLASLPIPLNPLQNSLGHLQNPLGALQNPLGGLLQNPRNPLPPFIRQSTEQTAFDRLLSLVGEGGKLSPSPAQTVLQPPPLPVSLTQLLPPVAPTGGAAATSSAWPKVEPSLASVLSDHSVPATTVSQDTLESQQQSLPPQPQPRCFEDTLDSSGDGLARKVRNNIALPDNLNSGLPFKQHAVNLGGEENWDKEEDAWWTGSSDTWTWILDECSTAEKAAAAAKAGRQTATDKRSASLCDDTAKSATDLQAWRGVSANSRPSYAHLRDSEQPAASPAQRVTLTRAGHREESTLPMTSRGRLDNKSTVAAVDHSKQPESRFANSDSNGRENAFPPMRNGMSDNVSSAAGPVHSSCSPHPGVQRPNPIILQPGVINNAAVRSQWNAGNGRPAEYGTGNSSQVRRPPAPAMLFSPKQTSPVALTANVPENFGFGNLLAPKPSNSLLIDAELNYNNTAGAAPAARASSGPLSTASNARKCTSNGALSQFDDYSMRSSSTMPTSTLSPSNARVGNGEEKTNEDEWQEVKTKKGKLLDRVIGELQAKHPNKTSKQITDVLQSVRTKLGTLNNVPISKLVQAASKILADKPPQKKTKAAIDNIPVYASLYEAPPRFDQQRLRKTAMCEFFQAGYCAAGIECVNAHDLSSFPKR